MKYVKGDRVIYTSNEHGSNDYNPLYENYKVKGTIYNIELTHSNKIKVNWDNGTNNSYNECDLELVNNQELQYEIC